MFYLGSIIVFLIIVLFIVSRINCSKYKAEDTKLQKIHTIGYLLSRVMEERLDLPRIKERIRKSQVVSGGELNLLARKYLIENISICIAIILFTGILLMLSDASRFYQNNENQNIVERENAGGFEKDVDVVMSSDNETTNITFTLNPRTYTKEEFEVYAAELYEELVTTICEGNTSLSEISSDINLPDKDETGQFEINWSNDYPEYISSTGRIDWDNIPDKLNVVLTAQITYEEFEKSYDFYLVIDKKDVGNFEKAQEELERLEQASRNDKDFVLPNQLYDVNLSFEKKEKRIPEKILCMGVLMCVLVVVLRNNKLDIEGKHVRQELINMYPGFVNSLWLFIGAGMTIKGSITMYVSNEKDCYLKKELECCLNQMRLGFDEAYCYEMLGINLGISEYSRLMNHISQNLVRGTKDIRRLMEDEISETIHLRKEHIKKKGEEASTKMLFPMMVMLCVVMVIIMAPAMMTF